MKQVRDRCITAGMGEHLAKPLILADLLVKLEALGDTRKPLLVSVRSGAPVSMPGMMDTLLNIGLCDATVHGLLRITGNPRLVWDSYCRLIRSFAEVVFGSSPHQFTSALDALLARERLDRIQELDSQTLNELAQTYLKIFIKLTGEPFPQNPFTQLELAVEAVFASWNSPRAVEYRRLHNIPDDLLTAVTIQRMVFGNVGGESGSGVGFTRDPDSGEKRLYFDFLFNSQGQSAGIGVAIGQLAFDIDAVRRNSSVPGRSAVLVREEMSTADIIGIALSAGVLTAKGNRTSHAAVVARQLGKPCICGCSALHIDSERHVALFGDRSLAEGETVTLDANTGRVYAVAAEIVIEWLDEIGKWRRSS